MAADVPDGTSLSFTMTLKDPSDGDSGIGNPSIGPIWWLSESDFRFTTYDPVTGEQRFMSRFAGRNEAQLYFEGTGQARIDFFECVSTTPTCRDDQLGSVAAQ
jgi:hypothetical protein